jgi:hypothetical protein
MKRSVIAPLALLVAASSGITMASAATSTSTTAVASRPTLTQLASAITTSLSQASGPDVTKSVPPLLQVSASDASVAGITWACYGATPTVANATTKCQWGSPTATRTILLTGDSQSTMWLPSLDYVGQTSNWKVVLFAHVGCAPWIDPNTVDFQGNSTADCRAYRAAVGSIIAQLKPQIIVPVGQAGTYGRGAYPTVTQLEGEMTSFVAEAAAVKAQVVLLSQIPQYLPGTVNADPNICLSKKTNITTCEFPYSTLSNPTLAAAQNWLVTSKKASLVNIASLFCATKCALFVNYQNVAHLVYYDYSHMNFAYADWIKAAFAQLARTTFN